ncbi:conserved hypothetical protein [Hyphomicrobiales bacterium]|jgi:hypothetical protein|nr:conserved hypothetical protein [Hyphomicrobiales bacterium]CAH1702168.1 conserved hypothetical protein [Hyphomicrobiales bacterium]CAI0346372.1 DUF2384 domain-containing protein [Hyphomicrobiales bacterium]
MTPEEIAALNRAIVQLLDRWKVDDEMGARILALDPQAYEAWKRAEPAGFNDDLKLRFVLLLHIHVQLRTLFTDPRRGYRWMNRPNAIFGQTPLDLLAAGDLNAILRLQAYLAAEIQAPF